MNKGKVSILETNLLYLITALLLVTIGAYVQFVNIKTGLVITQYILVLLPVIIFLKIKKENLRTFLRFNRLKFKHGLMTVGITLLVYPVAVFFNSIMLTILTYLGMEIRPLPIPMPNNFIEYAILFFIIAISAGICEEVFFRGLLLRVYGEKYKLAGVAITSLMFGIFHFNLQNLAGPIVLGLVFGYLVYITDSIYAGIIGHIANNGLAVTLMYGLNVLREGVSQYGSITPENSMPNTYQLIAGTITLGVIAAVSGFFAYLLIKKIKEDIELDSNNPRLDSDNLKDNLYSDNDTSYNNEELSYRDLTTGDDYDSNLSSKQKIYRIVEFIPLLIVAAMYVAFSFYQFYRL